MYRDTAGQKFVVFAFDATTGLPKTGDQANITVFVAKDYGTPTATTDTSVTQKDATNAPGFYLVDAAQAETNAAVLEVTATSVTANIVVLGVPIIDWPRGAAVETDIANTAAKAAQLNFTVTDRLDVNVTHFVGQEQGGAGTEEDPYGPV